VQEHPVEIEQLSVRPARADGLEQLGRPGTIVVGKVRDAGLRHGLCGALRLRRRGLGANSERRGEDDEEDREGTGAAPAWDHAFLREMRRGSAQLSGAL